MRGIIRRSASVVAVLAAFLGCVPVMAEDAPASQSSSENSPAASTPQPPTKPTGPSAETIKKALALGIKPEVQKGVTVFCWRDASTGSRFTTKKCVDETQLDLVLTQRQAIVDQLARGGTSRN